MISRTIFRSCWWAKTFNCGLVGPGCGVRAHHCLEFHHLVEPEIVADKGKAILCYLLVLSLGVEEVTLAKEWLFEAPLLVDAIDCHRAVFSIDGYSLKYAKLIGAPLEPHWLSIVSSLDDFDCVFVNHPSMANGHVTAAEPAILVIHLDDSLMCSFIEITVVQVMLRHHVLKELKSKHF